MLLMLQNAQAIALDPIEDVANIPQLTDRNGDVVLVDSRPVYRLPGVVIRDATGRVVKNSTVRVWMLPKKPIPQITQLRLVGAVARPWTSEASRSVSVTVTAQSVEVIGAGDGKSD